MSLCFLIGNKDLENSAGRKFPVASQATDRGECRDRKNLHDHKLVSETFARARQLSKTTVGGERDSGADLHYCGDRGIETQNPQKNCSGKSRIPMWI